MDATLSLVIALAIGIAQTFQAAVLGAASRRRGGREASLMAQLATAAVLAVLIAAIALDEGQTKLLSPLDSGWLLYVLIPLFALLLWLTTRGLPWWFASGGLVSLTLVLSPRLIDDLGLALFFAATTFGSCASALAFDHLGAFGAARRELTAQRLGGLTLVGAGVILVRVA